MAGNFHIESHSCTVRENYTFERCWCGLPSNHKLKIIFMNKKQIVMLGPSGSAMGGIATVVHNYEEAGLFEKWGIIFLTTHAEGSAPTKVFAAVQALYRFTVLLMQRRVALLHVHSAQYTSFWRKSIFALVAFTAGCPVIFHLHGCEFMKFYNERYSRIGKQFVQFIFAKSAVVIALSTQWVQNIASIATKANVVCIYNSVTVPAGQDALPQKERLPILLFLGRLGRRKGTYDLLDALVRVKDKIPNVVVKFGGDGELEEVKDRAKELGLEKNIEILGWVRGGQKKSLFDEAAIYVLPSYNEGLPMGILEAMSVGLPVISTTIGGIPDAIDSGKDGILIEPGDIDGLVHAIERLLHDADFRQEMGNAAREKVVHKFSTEKVVPQLEKLYRELGAEPALPQ